MMVTELERLMRESLDKATRHTKSIFKGHSLTVKEVKDFLTGEQMVVVATIKPSGAPHISSVGIIYLDGQVFFGIGPASRAFKNLQRDPRVALIVARGWDRQVLMEGEARMLPPRSTLARRVEEAEQKKFGWVSSRLFQVKPTKIFTWK